MKLDDQHRTPGQLIEDLLAAQGWTQRVLAIVLGYDEPKLNRIIHGKIPVDAKLALALGEVFGVEPEKFLDLQKSYDLARARIEARPDPGRMTRALLYGKLPIKAMAERGWINVGDLRDTETVESELTKFFGVPSVDEIEILPHSAKKTEVIGAVNPAQLAWLYRVKQIASEMVLAKYSRSGAELAIRSLRTLLSAAEEARKVPRILQECGIRFLIVESLPGAKIDGVTFWLNDNSPVVALALRRDQIDHFWFVLRHELEHVLCRHGKGSVMMDSDLDGENAGIGSGVSEEERIANEAAADFCIPRAKMDSFIRRKAPLFSRQNIIGFARTIGVHPGIVAGQLQHKTGRYDLFREHIVRIRPIVAPSALVDGWGDVIPTGNS